MYAETDSGWVATKKGIMVSVRILRELLAALKKTQAAAVKGGLIPQEDMTRCDRCDN